MVNVILLSLVSYAKEEAMLARLSDVTSSIPDLPEILLIPDSSRPVSGDPLNVSGLLQPFNMLPERILSRFIFRVIGSMSSALVGLFQVLCIGHYIDWSPICTLTLNILC